jgi:hypothetical protein
MWRSGVVALLAAFLMWNSCLPRLDSARPWRRDVPYLLYHEDKKPLRVCWIGRAWALAVMICIVAGASLNVVCCMLVAGVASAFFLNWDCCLYFVLLLAAFLVLAPSQEWTKQV